jgi:signal transduction histidine kinase
MNFASICRQMSAPGSASIVSVAMWRRLLDVVVILAIGAWAQADVWAPQLTEPSRMVGPRPVLSAAYLAATAALLFRRRFPFAVTLAVFATLAVPMLAFGASENLGAFLPPLLAMYSLGAHADLRRALGGLATAGAWSVLFLLTDHGLHTGADYARAVVYLAFFALPWAFGVVVRNPRLRAIEWERRATRLERERKAALEAAIRDERAHIARELHDVVSHTVGLIVLQAQAGDTRVDVDPAGARTALHSIERSAREAMVELRRMLGLLREDSAGAELTPLPGLDRLPALLDEFRSAGLDVRLSLSPDGRALSRGLDLNVFRILQEALTNSLRHGRATAADVCIAFGSDSVTVEIADNGGGSAPDAAPGHGLLGMQERVQLHGGHLRFGPRASGGFEVVASLPYETAGG